MLFFGRRQSGRDPSTGASPERQGSTVVIYGERIRAAREKSGLGWGELASRTRLTQQQLRQLEDGGTSSFHSYAYRLRAARGVARALGCPENAFLEELETGAADPGNAVEAAEAVQPAARRGLFSRRLEIPVRRKGAKRLGWVLRWCALIVLFAAGVVVLVDTPGTASLREHEAQADPPADSGVAMPRDSAVVSAPSPGCAPGDAPPAVAFVPARSDKAANAVEIVSRAQVEVCVADTTGVLLRRTLAAGEAIVVDGRAPFVVSASSYTHVEILFQGQKVRMEHGHAGPIGLIERPATLADPY